MHDHGHRQAPYFVRLFAEAARFQAVAARSFEHAGGFTPIAGDSTLFAQHRERYERSEELEYDGERSGPALGGFQLQARGRPHAAPGAGLR